MLKCSTSLWSANLANLEAEIRRVEPFSDRFHIDVADGHYLPTLLFFPDLVKSIRGITRLPFEVHLLTADPLKWVNPFVEAGADIILFNFDSTPDPLKVLRAIKSHGKMAGISLCLEEPISLLDPYWEELDLVNIIGTAVGIKGAPMDSSIPAKISMCRQKIAERGLKIEIEADGGIRRESVPLIHAAGADLIVPGSLLFGSEPKALHDWIASL